MMWYTGKWRVNVFFFIVFNLFRPLLTTFSTIEDLIPLPQEIWKYSDCNWLYNRFIYSDMKCLIHVAFQWDRSVICIEMGYHLSKHWIFKISLLLHFFIILSSVSLFDEFTTCVHCKIFISLFYGEIEVW